MGYHMVMWASLFHQEHGSKRVFSLASSCRNLIIRPLTFLPLLQLQLPLMRLHNNHMDSGNLSYVGQSEFNSQWGGGAKKFQFLKFGKSIIFPVFTMVEVPALVYLFFHIKHFLTNLLILKWCSEDRGSSKVRYLKIKICYLLCLVSHWLSDSDRHTGTRVFSRMIICLH